MNSIEYSTAKFSRIRRRRNLEPLFSSLFQHEKSIKSIQVNGSVIDEGIPIPQEFSPHQYAIFLIHVASELEHVLMVQYLYAAYSIGGSQIPLEHQTEVFQWREIILGIAKEEMGHLMTMQNLLRCLGGPLNLDREDFPWESEFYPFPFTLEALSKNSLAKYIVAESPEDWSGEEAERIKAIAKANVNGAVLHRVGALFMTIEKLLEDSKALKDEYFQSATYPFQATWDEWGRGYEGGARGNSNIGDMAMAGTPDIILKAVTARTDSLEALRAVATQGEANPDNNENAPSHFSRFLRIFRAMPEEGSWSPSMDIPDNPVAMTEFAQEDSDLFEWPGALITHDESKCWAHLFNIRYRLLLTSLLHSYDFSNNVSDKGQLSPRGLLIHSTFGEMYNLRAIAEILVHLPLADDGSKNKAGPPFQMPFTMKLPNDSVDRWRLHIDLLEASDTLISQLITKIENPMSIKYLLMLKKIDAESIQKIQTILIG